MMTVANSVELFVPREYQLEAAQHCLGAPTPGRTIIGDEMGIGKTGEGYLCWKALGKPAPTLILAGRNAQRGWRRFARNWGAPTPFVIRGTPLQRERQWKTWKHSVNYSGTPIVMMTPEVLQRDLKRSLAPTYWKLILVDEAHKYLNRKKTYYALLKLLAKDSPWIIPITGSPLKRGPQSVWALLNVLYPKKYSSYWAFIQRWCYTDRGAFGGMEILGPKDPDKLALELAPILIRRRKKDVLPELPDKTRDLDIRLDMTSEQEGIYEALVESCLADIPSGGLLVTPTVLAKLTRLRQLLCCPKILDPELGIGACLEHLKEMLDDTDDHHMVVFTPFKAAFPHIEQCLLDVGVNPRGIIKLQGGMNIDLLDSEIIRFQERRGAAICTVQFAESFDLVPATWAYFNGFEWDQEQNKQAEDRLHRMNTVLKTFYYYPMHRGGVDTELMLPILDKKTSMTKPILDNLEGVRRGLMAFKYRNKMEG